MRVFAIDDEQAMLDELCEAIAKAEPNAQICAFKRAAPALEALLQLEDAPDVIFSDIELPGIDGLTFSSRVKAISPTTKIVFVTAYPTYAVDAFRLHVDGFVVKPVEPERIREELDAIMGLGSSSKPRLLVRCFGNFEVFTNGKPLVFSRVLTKEFLAFLVDRAGGTCTSEEVSAALWEGRSVRNQKSYLRVLGSDLRSTLETQGIPNVLIHEHGQWAIRRDLMDCDYFRLLDGDRDAAETYHGEYMAQYSWAEGTVGRLYFISRSIQSKQRR